MITPGKDDNYPGGSTANGAATSGLTQYAPHGIIGITIAFIVILLAYHLLKGSPRRRRR